MKEKNDFDIVMEAQTELAGITLGKFRDWDRPVLLIEREYLALLNLPTDAVTDSLEKRFGKFVDYDGLKLIRMPNMDKYYAVFDLWKGYKPRVTEDA